jgi:uncharacterized membrane protein
VDHLCHRHPHHCGDRLAVFRRAPLSSSSSLRLVLFTWAGTCAAFGAAWAAGVWPHPFDGTEAIALGAVLNALPPLVGGLFVVTIGILGLVCLAWSMRAGHTPRPAAGGIERVAWVLAGICALVLVDGRLLMLVGYALVVSVLGWSDRGLVHLFWSQAVSPVTALLVLGVLGALAWGRVALRARRERQRRCGVCGRDRETWSEASEARRRRRNLQWGRAAVALAAGCAMLYPLARLPWVFGVPLGIDAESWATPGVAQTGIALGAAALGGVIMMTGLVRDWGVRVPGWTPALGGRRIPVALGVVPASIVALALTALGRGFLLGAMTGRLPANLDPVHAVVTAAMLPWGVALGLATYAYTARRRGPCKACRRGLAEQLPSQLRGHQRSLASLAPSA